MFVLLNHMKLRKYWNELEFDVFRVVSEWRIHCVMCRERKKNAKDTKNKPWRNFGNKKITTVSEGLKAKTDNAKATNKCIVRFLFWFWFIASKRFFMSKRREATHAVVHYKKNRSNGSQCISCTDSSLQYAKWSEVNYAHMRITSQFSIVVLFFFSFFSFINWIKHKRSMVFPDIVLQPTEQASTRKGNLRKTCRCGSLHRHSF